MATKSMKCSDKSQNALWTLDGMNSDALERFHALKDEYATEYEEMKNHLESTPEKGIRGILTQMRLNTRVWEYKLTSKIRVLYILNVSEKKVLVGFADQHLNKRRTDGVIRQLGKLC